MTIVTDAAVAAFHDEDDLWSIVRDPARPGYAKIVRNGKFIAGSAKADEAAEILQREATRAAIGAALAAMGREYSSDVVPSPAKTEMSVDARLEAKARGFFGAMGFKTGHMGIAELRAELSKVYRVEDSGTLSGLILKIGNLGLKQRHQLTTAYKARVAQGHQR